VHQLNFGNDGIDSCSCPGGIYRGRCRHLAAVRVLISRGVI
jgi:hypothetical protein